MFRRRRRVELLTRSSGLQPGTIVIIGQRFVDGCPPKVPKRIGYALPLFRLLREGKHIDAITDPGGEGVEICLGRGCREVSPPQTHVEGRVLAADEAGHQRAVFTAGGERQQQQRLIVFVIGDNDERRWCLRPVRRFLCQASSSSKR